MRHQRPFFTGFLHDLAAIYTLAMAADTLGEWSLLVMIIAIAIVAYQD